jgi:dolichol-phosphate mannosyltransferase
MNVVIVLPTYCEAENISPLIKRLEEIFASEKRDNFSILVVDDMSPDKTGEVVKGLAAKYRNLSLLSGKKEGLGKAYLRGLDYAIKTMGADVTFQMDADFSHDPERILAFVEEIRKGTDFVIGSRYVKGGSIPPNWGPLRKILSVFGNLIFRFGLGIFSIHDWTSGYRAIKSQVFEEVKNGLENFNGYTFQVAFLHRAYKAGFKIREIPINFKDREKGQSKIIVLDYIPKNLIYIAQNSTFLKYFVVGILGFTINTVALEFFYRSGISPGLAASLGAELAIVSNFNLNNFWTFADKKITGGKRTIAKFIQFNLTSLGAVIIQGVVVGLGTLIFGNETRFFFFVFAIVFLVIPYNFFVYNHYIWNKHEG